MKNYTRLFTVFSALVLISGCGRKTPETIIEKAIEKQTGGNAKVDLSENGVNIQTTDGSLQISSGESVKLPANFPPDVYVYEDARLEAVMQASEGSTLSLRTKEPVSKIAEKYQAEMQNKGWKQESSMNMGEQLMFIFTKDNRASTVIVTHDGGETVIAMTVANK